MPNDKPSRVKVGFFGCNGRVVRLTWRAPKTTAKAPSMVELDKCPGCGHAHMAKPFWRMYRASIDKGKEALRV